MIKSASMIAVPSTLFCLLLTLLCWSAVPAQVARYDFNGSLSDSVNGYDAEFIVNDAVTDPADAVTTAGLTDQVIWLDRTHGIKLPSDVTDALLGGDYWYFKMRFKITDWGTGDGDRMLINLKRSGTDTPPYFRVFAEKVDETTGQVAFRMRNRESQVVISAFNFSLDEWVDLSIAVDFGLGNYTITSASYYLSTNFEFDYENFKTYDYPNSLQNKQFHIGYYQNLSTLHKSSDERYNTQYSGDLIVDDLVVDNAPPATDTEVYETALQKLTDHLNGVSTLTDEEIAQYVSDALANFPGKFLTSQPLVEAYFEAYESNYPPMFDHLEGVDFYETYDKFGWVLLSLQLDVLDNYAKEEYIDQIEGLAFEAAAAFPGAVAPAAERLTSQTVMLNGTYIADPGYNIKTLQDDYGTFARRGTGLYAPPGERITVEVPAELVGIGAEVVIGCHTHDVSGKLDKIRRFPRVFKQFEITDGFVEVANPFGGIIYITIPEGTDLGPISIAISGAVKFPYFPKNTVNTGDIDEFRMLVASAEVPWAEVETDNFMYTGPLTFFKRDDIVETVGTWDRMWEAYQLYNGRPFPLHKAEHLVNDKMSKWNTLAGGYPMVLGSGREPYVPNFWVILGVNMMSIHDFEYAIQDDKATYWHEMSHHADCRLFPAKRNASLNSPMSSRIILAWACLWMMRSNTRSEVTKIETTPSLIGSSQKTLSPISK